MIDYIYAQLAGLFQPYPPTSFPEVFMCKGGEQSYATFDSFRRTWTFDITYDRSNLSFSQLYFNLFVNLAGQKREDRGLSLKPWGIALKFLFLHHENILFPND